MEFIDGRPLGEVLADESLGAVPFLSLFDQLLEALEYLHAKGIMHSDVKQANVLVRRFGDVYSATLVDLGVAKVVRPPEALALASAEVFVPEALLDINGRDREDLLETVTYFFSTPRITREEWRDRLRRPISREELLEMFPDHDLYALGTVLRDALQIERLRTTVREGIGQAGLTALLKIRDRLLTDRAKRYYDSVGHVRRDWAKLQPGYLSPLGVPELAIGASARTSIAVPSGRVSITDRVHALINHPLVQRLQNIPQLELIALVYPGGTHTRFLHSLSVYDMTRRYVSHLLNDPTFRLMVEPHDIEAVLLTALLHDIGHYPLSHMFEDFSEEERLAGISRTIPTDDDLFWAFLDPAHVDAAFTEFADLITDEVGSRQTGVTVGLSDYMREERLVSSQALAAMREIARPSTPTHRVLAGVLSSPIDADKVSYLIDDSLMTGVRYGLGIDLDALLGSLRAPREQDMTRPEPAIAIRDKGLPAAESVVLARYWMMRRVYWHHTNRAVIAMVKFVIARLLRQRGFTMAGYYRRAFFGSANDAVRFLTSEFDRLCGRDDVRNPLAGLIDGGREIYKRLVTVANGPRDEDRALYEALAFRRSDELDIALEAVTTALGELGAGRELKAGDVVVDVPLKRRESLGNPVLVYLQRDPDVAVEISSASPLVASLRNEFDEHVKKCRVFVHPELYRRLGANVETARSVVRDALRKHCGL